MHDASHQKFRHPWQRLLPKQGKDGTSETAAHYAAFQKYYLMPPGERSLRKVAQQVGKSETWIEQLSSRFHWLERAEQWDQHTAEMNDAAQAKAARERAAKWAVREEQMRDKKYEVGEQLVKTGQPLIGQPQVRKEVVQETAAGRLKQISESVTSSDGSRLIEKGFVLMQEAISGQRREDDLPTIREEFQNELYKPPQEESIQEPNHEPKEE